MILNHPHSIELKNPKKVIGRQNIVQLPMDQILDLWLDFLILSFQNYEAGVKVNFPVSGIENYNPCFTLTVSLMDGHGNELRKFTIPSIKNLTNLKHSFLIGMSTLMVNNKQEIMEYVEMNHKKIEPFELKNESDINRFNKYFKYALDRYSGPYYSVDLLKNKLSELLKDESTLKGLLGLTDNCETDYIISDVTIRKIAYYKAIRTIIKEKIDRQ